MALGEVTTQKIDNTITINKEGVSSVRIIYGNHHIAQDPDQFIDGSHNLILETASAEYLRDPAWCFNALLGENPVIKQYSRLLPRIQRDHISVYFTDLLIKPQYAIPEAVAMPFIEAAAASFLLDKKLFAPVKDRRDFIIRAGKALAGTWAAAPAATMVGSLVTSFNNKLHAPFIEASRLNSKLHPEVAFAIVTLRNAVNAHKLEWILSYDRQKPAKANAIFGAIHCVEWPYMVTAEERIKFLEKCRDLNIFKLLDINTEYLYKAVRLTSNGKGNLEQSHHEVPDLKALVR